MSAVRVCKFCESYLVRLTGIAWDSFWICPKCRLVYANPEPKPAPPIEPPRNWATNELVKDKKEEEALQGLASLFG